MGDIDGANNFLAFAMIPVVGAFWGVWKDKPHVVFTWIVIGVAYTLYSAAKFTWGLGWS